MGLILLYSDSTIIVTALHVAATATKIVAVIADIPHTTLTSALC